MRGKYDCCMGMLPYHVLQVHLVCHMSNSKHALRSLTKSQTNCLGLWHFNNKLTEVIKTL